VLEIGEFLLEPERRRLTKAGEPVAISAKAFDALVFLAERAGRVVPRAELCDS
jgi:DNA-binding winged helix-turn-helix (wHTH) protein